MNRLEKIILTCTALITLAGSLIACNKKEYPVTPTEPTPIVTTVPTPTETPIYTLTPTPAPTKEPTPTITPTPTLEAKLFEFSCDSCTDEEARLYSKIAEDDWNAVKKVYGVENGRMVVSASKKGGVGFGFYIDGKAGGSGGYMSDFTPDPLDRGHKHEMAHAINDTLFPTYHSWFDEGMANYAGGIKDFDINDPRVKAMVGQLNSNPNKFWESEIEAYTFPGSTNTPTHLIGSVFYYTLRFDYGLTEEQNRSAILYLADAYSSNGQEISRTDIQNAYEKALGKNLTAVFDIIGLGNKILWNAIMKAKPNQDYTEVKKMLSEF